ncbi:LytR C-terminal domain-containing protein [Nocardioides sp. WL0053]|uniref:LytR C-terminal domain-containing protein n=1 Tax=Nocardioides jiangsuensis TaxID=2866161 RepID=A0ABS7RJ43_9ACTN|nr:LytR C-terminal domain-containing protein [Nocardioides jiangsuensis]MBY9075062.1 LytR C-terminal domain-containing protein [Nocardioides jiangsuensis]
MHLRRGARRHDERGIAVPSPIAVLSLAAVALAGVAFVTTSGDPEEPAKAAGPVSASSSPSPSAPAPSPSAAATTAPKQVIDKQKPKKPKEPAVRRGQVYVEVYNNSGISGLAGSTASRIAGAGWQVVGSDNWYGTIPASTVYYPDRLEEEAELLAKDLGIARLNPAISPMRFDRLTVILTADFA